MLMSAKCLIKLANTNVPTRSGVTNAIVHLATGYQGMAELAMVNIHTHVISYMFFITLLKMTFTNNLL